MRLSDLTAGLLLMAGGLAVAGYAQTFPPMPGQDIGPSMFPTVIGSALALVGGVLAAAGLRRRDTPWITLDAWAANPRARRRAALVVASLVLYMAVVEALGFLITGALFLAALFAVFGVRRALVVPLAMAVTVVIHYGFYTMLHVPLPWGVLESLAW